MSVFVLSPDVVWNPNALETGSVPRPHLHRVAILPRREGNTGLILRLVIENEPLRYLLALTPFIVAMFVWNDLALPISQAPLFMLLVIGVVELRILRLSESRRAKVISQPDADRHLDTLGFRARRILQEIAARHAGETGEWMLVVEQSELSGIAPLTLVSVQTADGGPRLIALDGTERGIIRDGLFDADFSERDLHRANLRENVFLRTNRFDRRGVSGHARLAARLALTEKDVRA